MEGKNLEGSQIGAALLSGMVRIHGCHNPLPRSLLFKCPKHELHYLGTQCIVSLYIESQLLYLAAYQHMFTRCGKEHCPSLLVPQFKLFLAVVLIVYFSGVGTSPCVRVLKCLLPSTVVPHQAVVRAVVWLCVGKLSISTQVRNKCQAQSEYRLIRRFCVSHFWFCT